MDFLVLLATLMVANQQVTEHLLGSLVSGRWMALLSVVVGIVLLYGTYFLAFYVPVFDIVQKVPLPWLWTMGIFLALPSNIFNDFIKNKLGVDQTGARLIEAVPGSLKLGPISVPLPTPKLDANAWGMEANAIYNQFQIDKDATNAKAAVDALNAKYKGIAAPIRGPQAF